MKHERALHTHAVREFTHGKSRTQPAIFLADDGPFKYLDSLFPALDNASMHLYGVAGSEFGSVGSKLLEFDLLNELHFSPPLDQTPLSASEGSACLLQSRAHFRAGPAAG